MNPDFPRSLLRASHSAAEFTTLSAPASPGPEPPSRRAASPVTKGSKKRQGAKVPIPPPDWPGRCGPVRRPHRNGPEPIALPHPGRNVPKVSNRRVAAPKPILPGSPSRFAFRLRSPPLPSGRFPQQPLQKKTPARPHPWDARLGLRGASSLFPFVFPASHKAARHPPDHLSESRPLHKKGPPTAGPAADAPRTGLPFKQIGEETPKNGAPHPSTAPRTNPPAASRRARASSAVAPVRIITSATFT